MEVNIHEAKTHLSKLLRRVATGEEITISKAGQPIAKLVPIDARSQRRFGIDRGVFAVPEDFNTPLAKEWMPSSHEVPARHPLLVVAPGQP